MINVLPYVAAIPFSLSSSAQADDPVNTGAVGVYWIARLRRE
jgi:hypothetical protein